MSCKDKEGGTHHYACDCREAYVKVLESQFQDAIEQVDHFETAWLNRGDEIYQLECQLKEAEAKLVAKDALMFGEGWMKDGKRIHPSEIYKSEEVMKLESQLKKSLELGDLLRIYLSRYDRDEYWKAIEAWQEFRNGS